VEAQVLADQHGNVVVVGTRDCSLQRRHQKLVEEAPAPFLTAAQREAIHSSARAICREAGYHGAGTVEYLVGADGTVSFLEVNTRLQVEHPVTEETAGIDLVREQFRIADGEKLRFAEDPRPRGHSIEFRINGEDPGRGFLPAPGAVTRLRLPDGPGVRVDTGIEAGSVIGGNFDSLLAKVIVTGETRAEALERARRALDEMVVEGMATALPFHRLIVRDPAFVDEPFRVHTRWIETEFANTVPPFAAAAVAGPGGPGGPMVEERATIVVEVGGKRLEVSLPADLGGGGPRGGTPGAAAARGPAPRRTARKGHAAAASGNALASPMQGTIVKVAVEDGQEVQPGDLVVVLEAMKMEQPIAAHKAGTVSGLTAEVGATVSSGAVLCEITD
jgi:acetyl-CoA/propionyl-CoA carboxylase biotin carboxyl carrier protein